MSKYGPSRGELKMRVGIGVFICGLLVVAAFVRGVPTDLVGVELFVFCGGFGLGTTLWSLWKLRR
ncbi:MAG: hypothetical protein AAF340_04690 [Pseudomonadota bacterium]